MKTEAEVREALDAFEAIESLPGKEIYDAVARAMLRWVLDVEWKGAADLKTLIEEKSLEAAFRKRMLSENGNNLN